MRNSQFLFVISVLSLLLFQVWLTRYHSTAFSEPPPGITESVASANASQNASGVNLHANSNSPFWVRTPWLPEVLDKKLSILASARRGAISSGGNSLVDATVELHSAKDFIRYLPRAIQVGMLSPLPELWRGKASSPAMSLARKVVGAMTAFYYACLVGLIVGLIVFRKNLCFWIVFFFCFLGILVYAFTYPNIGSLMRFRYGFYMTLVSFGAAFIAESVINWHRERHPTPLMSGKKI